MKEILLLISFFKVVTLTNSSLVSLPLSDHRSLISTSHQNSPLDPKVRAGDGRAKLAQVVCDAGKARALPVSAKKRE
ncbi:hypothetical protein TIFTF001_006852 [Ficus carica]|uniref:Secreted protein n=1 Tax=Ficus carica TaxID=3494 RepID=A0AA88A1J8_FICCA|nr:hypothetical protein TIFTF001_006852 [Ficus carica]